MIQTHCVSTPRFDITKESGHEGPRYDPYSYHEFRVKFKSELQLPDIVLHEGLCDWIKIGKTIIPDNKPRQVFAKILGFSTDELLRWERRLKDRCHSCGTKQLECIAGYPGEFFTVCTSCGCIIETEFCSKYIE